MNNHLCNCFTNTYTTSAQSLNRAPVYPTNLMHYIGALHDFIVSRYYFYIHFTFLYKMGSLIAEERRRRER